MSTEIYIVEGANWKCEVSMENSSDHDINYILIEAATRCIEHIFSTHGPKENVEVVELTDASGVNFLNGLYVDDDTLPDPAFSFLTKIYKLKDSKKINNHYVIRTKILLENASAYEAVILAAELETSIKKSNPRIFKSMEKLTRNNIVFRLGDLPK